MRERESLLELLKHPETWSSPNKYDRYSMCEYGNNVCNTIRIGQNHLHDEIIDIYVIVQLDTHLIENIESGNYTLNETSPDADWADIVWFHFATVEKGWEDMFFSEERYHLLCEYLQKDNLLIEYEDTITSESEKKLYDAWKEHCYEKAALLKSNTCNKTTKRKGR